MQIIFVRTHLFFKQEWESDSEGFLHCFIAISISQRVDSTVQEDHVKPQNRENWLNVCIPIFDELKRRGLVIETP